MTNKIVSFVAVILTAIFLLFWSVQRTAIKDHSDLNLRSVLETCVAVCKDGVAEARAKASENGILEEIACICADLGK